MTEPSRAVFLSYASQDTEAARCIAGALRAAGIEVWFDQSELRGGDVWDQKIRKQIHDCALFVPIISAHSQERLEGYFRLEWKLAVDRSHLMATEKLFLVPVVIDTTTDQDASVPDRFRDLQWTRLPGGETPQSFCQRIAALLAGTEKPRQTHTSRTPSLAAARRPAVGFWLAVAATGVAIVGTIGWQPWRRMGSKPVAVPAAPPVVTATASVAPEKSIAVLPFVDMSEKKDQEYFAEGISEELIDTLARLPELHVAARTSSFYFKGRPSTVAEIGKALGVGNILEGSVRKAGDTLRITVQLVQANNGYHLWSDTYDRNVKDIFRTQDEIAASVVGALRLRLLASALPSRGGAENVDAYNLVLQGRFFSRVGDHQKARDCYQHAVALDPSYALAWAWLSYEWFYVPSNKAHAREAAMRAVELQPNLPDGHVALGQVHYFVDWNWTAADAEFKQALALDPNNSWALAYSGDLSYSLGHLQEAVLQLQRAAERDPFNAYAASALGDALWAAGRLDEAERVYGQVLGLSPNDARAREARALVRMAQGNVQAALSEMQQVSDGARQLQGLAILYFATGRKAESDRALAELSAKYSHVYPTWIAEVHAYRHEPVAAFEWLERAYRERDLWLAYRNADPLLASLHGDPRFKALRRKMNLPE